MTHVFVTARMRALEQGQRDRAWLAWTTAALMRQKKLPDLESLTRRIGAKAQTAEQQMAIFEMWNTALGGDVVSADDTSETPRSL